MYSRSNFRPNQIAYIRRQIGYDARGRAQLSEPVKAGVSIIRFETNMDATSIRADKSGTKSRAQEQVNIGRIQVEPKAIISIGDIVYLNDVSWKIDSIFPRMDQAGRLHHYQVDLVSWA